MIFRKSEESPSVEEEPLAAKTSLTSLTSLLPESQAKDVGLKPPRFMGEKDLSVKAKLAGVEITLADKHGELLTADTKGEPRALKHREAWAWHQEQRKLEC